MKGVPVVEKLCRIQLYKVSNHLNYSLITHAAGCSVGLRAKQGSPRNKLNAV